MEYRVLGPMDVQTGAAALRLGGPRQQTVLAVLLCHVNHTIAQDALIDAVWSGEPPEAARSTLHSYVYGLRQELGNDQIVRQGDGYRIQLAADELDALHFEQLVERGRSELADEPQAARAVLVAALQLWYGSAYSGLDDNPAVMVETARLRELRLVAVESRIEADLAIGNHDGIIGELKTLVREHPLREHFRAQHMLALYRSGRQAEALEGFRQVRELLEQELGLDPSSELRDLEGRILSQDPSLLPAPMGPPDQASSDAPATRDMPGPSSEGVQPGRSLRGYELRDPLGQGDFGTVFRAFQPSVGREVAIKVIRDEYANRPAFVQRFEREAQIVAQLEHPHIVPLFDYWRDARGAYLVMPLLRGGSLAAALQRGAWNLPPALKVLEQVGGALAHAHRRGVVHRDVKPGNVLLDEDGNAYLSDFGIALRLSDAADAPLTSSPGYVPPEELRGEPQTSQSDLFALGVLTQHLVTGVAPSTSGPMPSASGLRPDLPSALDDVIDRATDDNPTRRHERIEDYLRQLRRSVGADVVDVTDSVQTTRTDEPVRNPYKGLRAFRETDAADFFGREAMVDELLEAVARHSLVTVVGPSGSGKSSVVRAGLVPKLRAGGLPGSRDWLVTDMFPGSYPFEELEAALRRIAVDHRDSLLDELMTPHGLLRVTKRIVPDEDSTIVLLVDQFEELFSAVGSDAHRRLFLENLTAVAEDDRSRVRVVLTLRADFFDRPLEHARFAEAMSPGLVSIGPPSRDGLAQAIAAPARGVGVDLQPGLVGRIIADVEDEPGGLPLLQYTLTELFTTRSHDELTVTDYERTGGVRAALGRRAEELYAGLSPRTQAAARNLFLRLVTVDEASADTRRRARLSELRDLMADQDAIDQVLHDYGSFRLLSFDRDPTTRGPTVEVAHEALLREWDRLRGWIDERREELVLARRLATAVREWREAGHDASFLVRGTRLSQIEHWRDETDIALTAEERRYVDVSLEQRDVEAAAARRRRRQGVLALVGMLVIVSGLAATAWLQRGVAQAEARDAHVRELAGEATLAFEEDPERAVLVALEAVELSRTDGAEPLPEAVGALQETVQGLRLVARFDAGGPLALLGGDDPAVVHGDGRGVTMRSLADDRTIGLPTSGGMSPVVAHTETGLLAVGLGSEVEEAGVALHDRGGELVTMLTGPTGHRFVAVDITPSGHRVIGLSCPVTDVEDGLWCTAAPVVTVWNRATGASAEVAVEGGPTNLAFVTDDVVAVLTNAPSGVVLRDLADGATTFVPVDDGPLEALAVDHDGTRIAVTGAEPGAISLIDVDAAAVTGELPSSRERALAWSPDGQRLAATGNAALVRIIDVASGEVELELRGATDNLFFAGFTPDGRSVLAASFEQSWMWDVSRQGPTTLSAIAPPLGPSRNYAVSPDGELLVSFGLAQGLEVIDVATGRQVAAATDAKGTIDTGVNAPSHAFTLIGSVATDGSSTIRRLPDLTVLHELPDCTNALAFSPDDSLALVSGNACSDGANGEPTPSRVMRVDDEEPILELEHPWVFTAAFNPAGAGAGRYLALTDQRVVDVHDLETGEQLVTVTLEDVGSQDAGHLGMSFDASGRYLAVGMTDGRTWVLDVPALVQGATISESLVFNQVTHTGPAPAPAITADGVIATAGFDELVRLWDLETGELLTEFRTDLSIGLPSIRWSHDETELLYPDAGIIRRFPRDVDDLVTLARGLVTRDLTQDECLRHLSARHCGA